MILSLFHLVRNHKAEVSLNNIPVGTTPTTVMVKRKFGKTRVTYAKKDMKLKPSR